MFEIGDKVWYRGRWGQDPPVAAIITGSGEKNGKAAFDCRRENALNWGTSWGYPHQFESRACHLCGAATDAPSCPLCPACAEEQQEQEQDTKLEMEQRRRPR